MLKHTKPFTLPCLTDTTLMAVNRRQAAPDDVRRLYTALLDIGVMVQIPADLVPWLGNDLAPERTLLAAGADSTSAGAFTGILSDPYRPWQTRVMKECTLDTEVFPSSDTYRLTVAATEYLPNPQFSAFIQRVPKPVMLCARGETQLATALSVCWLLQGGACTAVSLMGRGEHAALEAVVMALTLQGERSLRPAALRVTAAAWERMTGESIPSHQPVIGPHIFDVSSGVHVNGLLKDAESYEPFPPDMVGRERRIVLDQHSGQSAVAARLYALGISTDSIYISLLTQRVRAVGRETGEVDEEMFLSLIHKTQRDVCA